VIYVGPIVLYFIAIFVDCLTATPGAVENDSPESRPIGLVAGDLYPGVRERSEMYLEARCP
jgi:hypothetical protein